MKTIAPILKERNLTINEGKKQYNIQLTEHTKMTGRNVNTLEHY